MQSTKDVLSVATRLLAAVAAGELSPEQAAKLGSLLELVRGGIESHELAERVVALEEAETAQRGRRW